MFGSGLSPDRVHIVGRLKDDNENMKAKLENVDKAKKKSNDMHTERYKKVSAERDQLQVQLTQALNGGQWKSTALAKQKE